jgi:hypothetical protein
MTSDYNNALTYTANDFFQLNMYQGDIIKTVNLMNLTLAQQFPDSAQMRHARDSIESQLRDFEARLWLPRDTAQAVINSNARNNSGSSARASRSNTSNNNSNVRASTPSAPSAPARSVRRR